MKFNINPDTKDEEIIQCAKYIQAWLFEKDKLKDIDNMSISLIALANGDILPEERIPEKLAIKTLKEKGYKVYKEI